MPVFDVEDQDRSLRDLSLLMIDGHRRSHAIVIKFRKQIRL
jgi:hypothetical protein